MQKIRKNFLKRWKLIAVLILILALGGFWYYRTQASSKEKLTFVTPDRGELIKTLEVSGNVTAKEYAKMRFAAGGKLVYVGAKEGDTVSKGKAIATIDQASLRKNLEKSLNFYEQQRLDWDQTLDDTKDRALPKSEERTKASEQITLENSVIDVEITSIAIRDTVLAAPFSGVLISSPAQFPGVNLSPTDTFEFINPNTLIFQALVDEIDIDTVKNSLPVKITLDAYPDETIDSTIKFISYKSFQSETGTAFLVEMPLSAADINRFRIGLNGDAMIELERKDNVLSVPLDAITERDDKTFVQVKVDDYTSEEREIQVGMETDDRIEVVSGLSDDDQIVLPN